MSGHDAFSIANFLIHQSQEFINDHTQISRDNALTKPEVLEGDVSVYIYNEHKPKIPGRAFLFANFQESLSDSSFVIVSMDFGNLSNSKTITIDDPAQCIELHRQISTLNDKIYGHRIFSVEYA